MEKIVLIVASVLSCFIIVHLLIQHMNDRFEQLYRKRVIYVIIEVMLTIVMALINLVGNSTLNLSAWICLIGIIVGVFYCDVNYSVLKRILECEALLLIMTIFEGMAVILIDLLLNSLNINIISMTMKNCIEITFSKLLVIFAYYMVIHRVIVKKVVASKTLYWIYFIVFVYSFFNMLIIAEAFKQGETNLYLTINMGCIVLAVLYLVHFIKIANDKNCLEYELKMLEKQTDMQYKYYLEQEKKHNRTVQILHDVNKHIKAIEQLYATGNKENANEYTDRIVKTLKPLIPIRYTGNPILDILLTDKKRLATEKNIKFEIKINNVDINFIEAIELTTIFGNLLDNAIEACENIEEEKKIILNMEQYHEMVIIRIENTCGIIKWRNGFPISEKGKNRGIGLNNVRRCIEKYDGNINFKQQDNYFVVDMFLNS